MPKSIYLLLIIVLLRTCFACQTTAYVSTSGSDSNDGSIGNPFATINYAITLVNTGVLCEAAVILVSGGVYTAYSTTSVPFTVRSTNSAILSSFTVKTGSSSWDGFSLSNTANIISSNVSLLNSQFANISGYAVAATGSKLVVDSCRFENNWGGVLANKTSTFLYRSKFIDNSLQAGFVAIDDSTAETAKPVSYSSQEQVIDGCVFERNTNALKETCAFLVRGAPCGGGAMHVKGGVLKVSNSVFKDNFVPYNTAYSKPISRLPQPSGGAIFGTNLITAMISNSTFIGNSIEYQSTQSQGFGSALRFVKTAQLLIDGSSFIANQHDNFVSFKSISIYFEPVVPDAGMSPLDNEVFEFRSSSITDTSTTVGLLYISGAFGYHMIFSNSTFSNIIISPGNPWMLNLNGINNFELLIAGCTFRNVTGGTLLSSTKFDKINMTDSIHENISPALYYFLPTTRVYFQDNTIFKNITVSDVLVSYSGIDQVTILNSKYIEINALKLGEFINIKDGLLISSSYYANNVIRTRSAVDIQRTPAIINDCTFVSNTGVSGGAVYILNSIASNNTVSIIGSTFTGNTSPIGGAVYFGDSSDCPGLFISDSTFDSNVAATSGGAVYVLDGDIVVSGSKFVRNTATMGGAIYISNLIKKRYSGEFTNSTFTQNSASIATGSGGSIYFFPHEDASKTNQSIITLTECVFEGSSASSGGAVMQFSTSTGNSSIVVYNSCIFNSSHAKSGGAIYSSQGFSTTIVNTVFDKSEAISEGGCIYQLNSKLDISSTNFSNSAASVEGAAIYVLMTVANKTVGSWNDVAFLNNAVSFTRGGSVSLSTAVGAVLTISGATFTGNQVGYYGGALAAVGTFEVILNSPVFSNNQAFQGGAIYLDESASITVNGGRLEGNVATDAGGAVTLTGTAKGRFVNVEFKGNSATSNGGAAYTIGQSTPVFEGCLFSGNGVDTGSGGSLSASTTTYGYPALSNCRFENNTAANGGAAYVFGSASPLIVDTKFIGNVAAVDGGAIITAGRAAITLRNSRFTENVAHDNGGAIKVNAAEEGYPVADNCRFNKNRANNGGAVYLLSRSSVFSTCIFEYNSATSGGAAYVAQSSSPRFGGSTFSNNLASTLGGAVYCDHTANPKFVLSNFNINNATSGGAVAALSKCYLSINSSNFEGNVASNFGGAVYAVHDTLAIQESTFRNSVADYGGTLYLANGLDSNNKNTTFAQNTFSGSLARSAGGVYFWDFSNGKPVTVIQPNCVGCTYENNNATGYGELYATKAYQQKFAGNLLSLNVTNNVIGPITVHVYDIYGQFATRSFEEMQASVQLTSGDTTAEIYGSTQVASRTGSFEFETINVNGFFGGKHTLVFLLGGVVAPITLNLTIMECSPGQEAYTAGITNYQFCRDCSTGFYNLNANGTCLACPAFAICSGTDKITALNDYWAYQNEGVVQTYQCPSGYCIGGGCTEHRSGLLCGKCDDGYQELNGSCIQCEGNDPASLFGTFVLLWLYVSFLQLTNREPGKDDSKKKYVVSGLTKIIVFYVQTVSLLSSPQESIRKLFSFLSFQFFLGIAGRCSLKVSFYEDFLINILIPVILFILLGANLLFHTLLNAALKNVTSETAMKWKAFFVMDYNLYVKTFCALLLFSYTSVTQSVFTFLNCRNIGIYSVVATSPTVMCNGDEYSQWSVLAYFLLAAYVVLMPIALFIFLLYNHVKGNLRLEKYEMRMGVLFQCFRDSYYFWDVVILLRRLFFVVIYVTAYQYVEVKTITLFCFAFLILAIHLVCQPYRSKVENRIETALLACLLVIAGIECSAARFDSIMGPQVSIFSTVVTFIAAIPIVVGLYKLILDFLYRVGLVNTSNTSKITKVFGVSMSSTTDEGWTPRYK